MLALTPIAASQRRFKVSRSGAGSDIGGAVRSRFNVSIVHQKTSSLGLGLGVGCLWSGMSRGASANQHPQTAARPRVANVERLSESSSQFVTVKSARIQLE